MDINLTPDGSFISLSFDYELLFYLLVIAISVFFICKRLLKRRANPKKPKKWHIAIFTVATTIIVYIILVITAFFVFKMLYL